jgi:hypothetical protein
LRGSFAKNREARLRACGHKSVVLAMFSGITKPQSPTSLHSFFTTTD